MKKIPVYKDFNRSEILGYLVINKGVLVEVSSDFIISLGGIETKIGNEITMFEITEAALIHKDNLPK